MFGTSESKTLSNASPQCYTQFLCDWLEVGQVKLLKIQFLITWKLEGSSDENSPYPKWQTPDEMLC